MSDFRDARQSGSPGSGLARRGRARHQCHRHRAQYVRVSNDGVMRRACHRKFAPLPVGANRAGYRATHAKLARIDRSVERRDSSPQQHPAGVHLHAATIPAGRGVVCLRRVRRRCAQFTTLGPCGPRGTRFPPIRNPSGRRACSAAHVHPLPRRNDPLRRVLGRAPQTVRIER